MTEFIAPPAAVATDNVDAADHAQWINTTIENLNEANTPLIFSSVKDNSDSSSDDNGKILLIIKIIPMSSHQTVMKNFSTSDKPTSTVSSRWQASPPKMVIGHCRASCISDFLLLPMED
jgi:hypothetical protein